MGDSYSGGLRQSVSEVYFSGEVRPDQTGTDSVKTFTFRTVRHLIVILSTGGVSRVNPFGGTPSATFGIRCDDGVMVHIPYRTTIVKVYVPSGVVINLWGLGYT